MLNRFNDDIFNVAERIKPSTIGVDILIKVLKKSVCLILFIKIEISKIIINDGRITPEVATSAPSILLV